METLDALLGESLDHACARIIAHDRDEELKQMAILFFTFQVFKKNPRYLAYQIP